MFSSQSLTEERRKEQGLVVSMMIKLEFQWQRQDTEQERIVIQTVVDITSDCKAHRPQA